MAVSHYVKPLLWTALSVGMFFGDSKKDSQPAPPTSIPLFSLHLEATPEAQLKQDSALVYEVADVIHHYRAFENTPAARTKKLADIKTWDHLNEDDSVNTLVVMWRDTIMDVREYFQVGGPEYVIDIRATLKNAAALDKDYLAIAAPKRAEDTVTRDSQSGYFYWVNAKRLSAFVHDLDAQAVDMGVAPDIDYLLSCVRLGSASSLVWPVNGADGHITQYQKHIRFGVDHLARTSDAMRFLGGHELQHMAYATAPSWRDRRLTDPPWLQEVTCDHVALAYCENKSIGFAAATDIFFNLPKNLASQYDDASHPLLRLGIMISHTSHLHNLPPDHPPNLWRYRMMRENYCLEKESVIREIDAASSKKTAAFPWMSL